MSPKRRSPKRPIAEMSRRRNVRSPNRRSPKGLVAERSRRRIGVAEMASPKGRRRNVRFRFWPTPEKIAFYGASWRLLLESMFQVRWQWPRQKYSTHIHTHYHSIPHPKHTHKTHFLSKLRWVKMSIRLHFWWCPATVIFKTGCPSISSEWVLMHQNQLVKYCLAFLSPHLAWMSF